MELLEQAPELFAFCEEPVKGARDLVIGEPSFLAPMGWRRSKACSKTEELNAPRGRCFLESHCDNLVRMKVAAFPLHRPRAAACLKKMKS